MTHKLARDRGDSGELPNNYRHKLACDASSHAVSFVTDATLMWVITVLNMLYWHLEAFKCYQLP